ncbi:hypothetical protein EHQ13_04860 [Leptospira gomenensis]|uniref:Uncharacterized protein n=1 Tax=Leptospira gomenensis TaxID=2484974 RepID=A0A5F1Z212_9LEPT|nr:hypothetical protein [Leptospira gomenensis]TGK29544.1 hypothetical protein EHQ17_15585 [Leptospira gomenensis]TGK43401.1 hypothetical protein EHQ07_12650 [Leptospira gomenensis]TGK65701.1 hypothetical protein EHQ13_04860 [Leptospira gomenensis]
MEIIALFPFFFLSSAYYALEHNKHWVILQKNEFIHWHLFYDEVGSVLNSLVLLGILSFGLSIFNLQRTKGSSWVSLKEAVGYFRKNYFMRQKLLLLLIIFFSFFFSFGRSQFIQFIFLLIIVGEIYFLFLTLEIDQKRNLIALYIELLQQRLILIIFIFLFSVLFYSVFIFFLSMAAVSILTMFQAAGGVFDFRIMSFFMYFSLRFISLLILPLFIIPNFLCFEYTLDSFVIKKSKIV